jgi:hypothetical protein
MRQTIATYVAHLREEQIDEAEIRWRVEGASIEVMRKMGALPPGEEVPAELYQAMSAVIKDVMEHGATAMTSQKLLRCSTCGVEIDQSFSEEFTDNGQAGYQHSYDCLTIKKCWVCLQVIDPQDRLVDAIPQDAGAIAYIHSYDCLTRDDVVYPNSWRVCIIKLVHVGLRSAFSRLASLINWRCTLSHLFNIVQK